jgi:MFS transporter, BCD family, chlorophyll transporter
VTLFGIVRLGLVQASIGALVMLSTSLLNRVMVVEFQLAAAFPAGLVAWHYAVQLSRPAWGHGSDRGSVRTPWIIAGMAVLAVGTLLAVDALTFTGWQRTAISIFAFTMIGGGVGAAGTSLLALLARMVAPERRGAAAAITWIMMIAGIIMTAGVTGQLIDPFSMQRMAFVTAGVALAAFVLTVVALWGVERLDSAAPLQTAQTNMSDEVKTMLRDPRARSFTGFVFISMLAYSMQDMILEPFSGLLFDLTPGASTKLTAVQHMGVLIGMLLVGIGAGAFGGRDADGLRRWTVLGCLGSAVALVGLTMAARFAPAWPLAANVALLGFCNGVFAVSAIGTMMALAGEGDRGREGIRMGVWGASQAAAFGLGGLLGAVGVDVGRRVMADDAIAFSVIFGCEAVLFIVAAAVALRATSCMPVRGQWEHAV